MPNHDFIPGVTDAGKPRAAKGGFPYPGHGTMADQRRAEEASARARDALFFLNAEGEEREHRTMMFRGSQRLRKALGA